MADIDATTWQALGITLSAVGLVVSLLLWKRRGAAAGLRGVAWSLLPAAAGLTGTLRLLWQIGDSVVTWALRLVFSPVVWVGILLAGVSVVLFGVSAAVRSRGAGSAGDRHAKAPRPSASELPAQRSARKSAPVARRDEADDENDENDENMDDIEAILKKHGIS